MDRNAYMTDGYIPGTKLARQIDFLDGIAASGRTDPKMTEAQTVAAYDLAVDLRHPAMNVLVSEVKMVCPKCNGKGTLHWLRHVADGVCFACNGKGRGKNLRISVSGLAA